MDIAFFFFNFSPDFSNHYFFFPPIFGNTIATIAKKKIYSPISAMALPQLVCQFFFFSFHFGHSTHTSSRIGHKKFGIPVAEIQHFFSPPFSSSLSYFWLNFSNGNTEIQSLSSKSQISLNSSYNANKLQILQY